MSEKSFAFASVSVAIVLGVFFYPPPARQPGQAPTVKQGARVGPLQQARTALPQSGSRSGEIGVD